MSQVWDAKTTDCLKTFTPNPATSVSVLHCLSHELISRSGWCLIAAPRSHLCSVLVLPALAQSSLTVTGLQLLPKIPDRMYVATRSKDLRILSIGGQVSALRSRLLRLR